MSSTVARKVVFLASLAFSVFFTTSSRAAQRESEARIVAQLYKAYAWQAIATQPDLFGEGLAGASKAELQQFFTPTMAQLLQAESACQVQRGEICNLDFDLLFDSQDPRVSDLTVERSAHGGVRVQFNDPVTDKKTVVEFKLALQHGQWRIADIIYPRHPQHSLKAVLTRSVEKQSAAEVGNQTRR